MTPAALATMHRTMTGVCNVCYALLIISGSYFLHLSDRAGNRYPEKMQSASLKSQWPICVPAQTDNNEADSFSPDSFSPFSHDEGHCRMGCSYESRRPTMVRFAWINR